METEEALQYHKRYRMALVFQLLHLIKKLSQIQAEEETDGGLRKSVNPTQHA